MGQFTVGSAALNAIAGMPFRAKPRRSGAPHRTGAPVLRDSIEDTKLDEGFFQLPSPGEPDRMLRIARKTLDAGKRLRRDARAGTRTLSAMERLLTQLTASAVRVYEELTTLCRLNKGRVYPSYDHLEEATGLGRSTIRRSLAVLEAIGFLVRQRRFTRVEAEGPGPRWKQTSNAYRLLTPKCVLGYLPRWLRPAPLPVDDEWRREAHADDIQHMLKSLSCSEFAKATVGGDLGKWLARLGAAVDQREREVQSDPQPLMDSYI